MLLAGKILSWNLLYNTCSMGCLLLQLLCISHARALEQFIGNLARAWYKGECYPLLLLCRPVGAALLACQLAAQQRQLRFVDAWRWRCNSDGRWWCMQRSASPATPSGRDQSCRLLRLEEISRRLVLLMLLILLVAMMHLVGLAQLPRLMVLQLLFRPVLLRLVALAVVQLLGTAMLLVSSSWYRGCCLRRACPWHRSGAGVGGGSRKAGIVCWWRRRLRSKHNFFSIRAHKIAFCRPRRVLRARRRVKRPGRELIMPRCVKARHQCP